MPDFFWGALMGIAGTLLGTFITYLLSKLLIHQTHMNAIDILKRTEFNRAAAIFRDAFIGQKFMLTQNSFTANDKVHRIITPEVLIQQDKAKIAFEPVLTPEELEGFNAAWLQYFNSDYRPQKPFNPENVTDRNESPRVYRRLYNLRG